MRLYSGTSRQFVDDTTHNQIAGKLEEAFFNYFRYKPNESEKRSWRESLKNTSLVFLQANLMDHGILLEYQLPLSSKRLDCMICGKDDAGKDNAVIMELKQWEKCRESGGTNEVITYLAGCERDVLHPSVQVGRYNMYLEDTQMVFYDGKDPIQLNSCAYLHNYKFDSSDVIFSDKFKEPLEKYPLFTMDDVDKLQAYLIQRLKKGSGMEVLERVEKSKYKPSKKFMQHVSNVIKHKSEYILLDEQLVAYDKVLECAKKTVVSGEKSSIIIDGGPGTGKSVIAINLMADLMKMGLNAQYATGSRAFTQTLQEAIGDRGSSQFKYFNSYAQTDKNEIDVLICDESHRIRVTSNNRFTKKEYRSNIPQIQELMKAAKVTVFFIDDKQVVRPGEIGSSDYIRKTGIEFKHSMFDFKLDIQFRCAGSEAFVGWVNNTLEIEKTPYVIWNQKENFDFKIFDSPEAVEKAIRAKATDETTARMTAGYCWKWSMPDNDGNLVNDVEIGAYKRPWNAKPEAKKLAKGIPKAPLWAYSPGGIDQVGCIYTAQGFEFDYVGVIFGTDLCYNFENGGWEGHSDKSFDGPVKNAGDKFLDLAKNTYRVLLSRGMKGCYVCFLDKETEKFFKSRMEK